MKILLFEYKELLIDQVLILFSFAFVKWYLHYVKKKYGKRPSISSSAGNLYKDGNQILFYLFITLGICVPMAYVGRSWLTAFASIFLFLIGIITGHDQKLKGYNKAQDVVHVIAVYVAIFLFLLGIVFMNIWYLIPIGIAFIPIVIIFIMNGKYRTWNNEEIFLYLCWGIFEWHRVISIIINKLYE